MANDFERFLICIKARCKSIRYILSIKTRCYACIIFGFAKKFNYSKHVNLSTYIIMPIDLNLSISFKPLSFAPLAAQSKINKFTSYTKYAFTKYNANRGLLCNQMI
jgi:hypothetical protein